MTRRVFPGVNRIFDLDLDFEIGIVASDWGIDDIVKHPGVHFLLYMHDRPRHIRVLDRVQTGNEQEKRRWSQAASSLHGTASIKQMRSGDS